MITTINEAYDAARRALRDRELILESVIGVEEVIPGSDEEMEDIIDVESVPQDVYAKVDKLLDQLVEREDYDDTEVDELADDEYDEGEVDDAEIDAIMESATGMSIDDIPSDRLDRLIEAACSDWLGDMDEKALDPNDLNKKISPGKAWRLKAELIKKDEKRGIERRNKTSNLDEESGEDDEVSDVSETTTLKGDLNTMLTNSSIDPSVILEAYNTMGDEEFAAFCESVEAEAMSEASKKPAKKSSGKNKKGSRKLKLIEALKKKAAKATPRKIRNESWGDDDEDEDSLFEAYMEDIDLEATVENCEDLNDEEFDEFCEAVSEDVDELDERVNFRVGKTKVSVGWRGQDSKGSTPAKKKRADDDIKIEKRVVSDEYMKKNVPDIYAKWEKEQKAKNESTSPYAFLHTLAESTAGELKDWCPEEAQDQAHQMGTAHGGSDFQDWNDTSDPYTGEPDGPESFPDAGGSYEEAGSDWNI